MKKLFFLAVLLFTSTFVYSQRPISAPPVNRINDGLISSNNRYGSKVGKGEISYDEALMEYKQIDGSPFLHGGEILVDLIDYNDSIIKAVKIRYDLYNQEVIVSQKKGGTLILDQVYYKGFIYDNKGTKERYLRLHPSTLKFNKVLFQNDEFAFCQEIKPTITKDNRHVPGLDLKNKKFTHKTYYYIIQGKLMNKVSLKNNALVTFLPWKYRRQVKGLKKKLKIKKLNKEKDYLLLMNAFEDVDTN